jgi:GntR family transcriptional regulator
MEILRYAPISSQIENILLDRIQNGTYTSDMTFPSEAELCLEFKVSRATVRTAISALTAKGLLIRRPGRGTFLVESLRLNSGLEQLESVLSIAKRQGMIPEVGDLSVKVINADKNIAVRLGCKENEQITYIQRTVCVAKKTVSLHIDYVPNIFLSTNLINSQFDGSVLDLLKLHHSPPLKEAVTEITSVNATHEQSTHLGIKLNSALILLRETVYDEGGEKVSYSENFFVPDRFYLHVLRRKNLNQSI